MIQWRKASALKPLPQTNRVSIRPNIPGGIPDIMLKAITAEVVQAQSPPDAIPLTLNAGDPIRVGQRHPERSDYVWCEDGQISAGWVPIDLIDVLPSGARANATYCSAELEVAVGDTVRLMWVDRPHHAWWCENAQHERGWVPESFLRFEGD